MFVVQGLRFLNWADTILAESKYWVASLVFDSQNFLSSASEQKRGGF
jgi:hypothetical protein